MPVRTLRDSRAAPRGPTTLPSVGQAMDRIEEGLRREGALGVVVMDASPLESIERVYGAATYRQARDVFAARVRELVDARLRPGDLLVRGAGGVDELALILFRSRHDRAFYADGLPALAEALRSHLARNLHQIVYPYRRAGTPPAVGHALALHNPTLREERQVFRALEAARREAALCAELEARRRRERLVRLVVGEEITSCYEPIASLADGELLGYEALARGPEGTDLRSPNALFQLAEESNLLFELDSLCRRAALRGARDLPPGRKLFLNCLPAAVHDPSFRGDALRASLEELRLRPSDVVLEISEKMSIDNFSIFREARDHYASLGFQIALDDTGAGYSSLEAVMELSPDFIKVDLSLVRSIESDPPRQELLRALRSVAESIDARIIAEGIESDDELEALRRIGIPYGQGYLLGRAAPLRAGTPARPPRAAGRPDAIS